MQEFIPQLSGCCFLELFCDCASQTYFFFRSYFIQYVSCQIISRSWRYCTVIPKENNIQYFVSEKLVLWGKETEIWWIPCSDVVWIPDCIRCRTLTSKFDSFDLILFARCKQSGSQVCNKWMVLQDFLFLPLCLSSYDWINMFLVSHKFG